MLGNEGAMAVLRGKNLLVVEDELQRRHMRTQREVRRDCLGDHVWPRGHTIVGMVSIIGIGPAIEAALRDMREIVGGDFICNIVTFVHRGPERAGFGMEPNSYGIAQTAGIDLRVFSIGIGYENRSAAAVFFNRDVGGSIRWR